MALGNFVWNTTVQKIWPIFEASQILHSGRYGHKNETQILEIVAFIMQFYTYFNTYDMN